MSKTEPLYDRKQFLMDIARNGEDMYGYFIEGRCCVFPEVLAERYGFPDTIENMPDYMVSRGNVAPESVEAWLGLFAAIDRGERKGVVYVSLKSEHGDFIRYCLRFNGISDEEGKPFCAMISFEDVERTFLYNRLRENDINGLLQVTQSIFPEILTLNITQYTYRIIQYDSTTAAKLPREGNIDDMLRLRVLAVLPEDRESFAATFSMGKIKREALEEGRNTWQLAYRRFDQAGNVYWMETTVMRQHNAFNDDILLVTMTRGVDEQKAEEIRLREQLRQQKEELRLTMSQMGKTINYYDIPSATLTVPQPVAEAENIPSVIHNFPEYLFQDPPEKFPPESLEAIRKFYESIRNGEAVGACEYRTLDQEGLDIWTRVEYVTIFDDKKQPVRAVIAAENITNARAIATERTRLKNNEKILHVLNQHSERKLVYYDLETKQLCSWDEQLDMSGQNSRPFSPQFRTNFTVSEGTEQVEQMFQDIYRGVPYGELRLSYINKKQERRWINLKYSTLFDEEHKPTAVVFSHKDITDLYEHEIVYQRHVQSLELDRSNCMLVVEYDVTADCVERVDAYTISMDDDWTGRPYSELVEHLLGRTNMYESEKEVRKYFSCDYLLQAYARGKRQLKRQLHARLLRDGIFHWLNTEVTLVADSYTGHVKGFFRMRDVTDEKEKELEIQFRSERDGMTGLLNRETAERRIREAIDKAARPGILVLLDLDDLKGINDNLGHTEGDRAIRGIANMLKAHFRENDIIGRLGGDEFIVYLPGSAESRDAIAVSMATLLRKLSNISVGKENERRLHCSIGCAVQTDEADTFDILYRQADIALYQVKRGGKNNFSFYSQDKENADLQFQEARLDSLRRTRKFDIREMQYLIEAVASAYLMIVSVNLSVNDYFLLETKKGFDIQEPIYGFLDDFIRQTAEMVHPDDRHVLGNSLSQKTLLEAYARGEEQIVHYLRFLDQGQYMWVRAAVFFYVNEHGDVCDFTFFRKIDDMEEKSLESR